MSDIEKELKHKQHFAPKHKLPNNFTAHTLERLDDNNRKRSWFDRAKGFYMISMQKRATLAALSVLAVAGISASTYAVVSNWPTKTTGETTLIKTLPSGTRIVKTTGLPKSCGRDLAADGNAYFALRKPDHESLKEFDASIRDDCDSSITQDYMDSVLSKDTKPLEDQGYALAGGDGRVQSNDQDMDVLKLKSVDYTYMTKYRQDAKVYANGTLTKTRVSDLKPGDKIYYYKADSVKGRHMEMPGSKNNVTDDELSIVSVYVLPANAHLPSDAWGTGVKKDASTDAEDDPFVPVTPDTKSQYGYKVIYNYQGSL